MDKNRDSYRGGFQEVCMEIDIIEAFKDCTRSQHSEKALKTVYEKSTNRCILKNHLEMMYKKYAPWKCLIQMKKVVFKNK